MDYNVIGSIGFAQLGSNDYYAKRKIENQVTAEFMQTEEFKIPYALKPMCRFGIKKFPYEGSSYDEVVLYYNQIFLDDWESDDDERFEEFWDFSATAECIDFESEELMEKCNKLWRLANPMEKVYVKTEPEEIQLKKAE